MVQQLLTYGLKDSSAVQGTALRPIRVGHYDRTLQFPQYRLPTTYHFCCSKISLERVIGENNHYIRLRARPNIGCSQNYGPLLFADCITAPSILGY